MEIIKYTKTKHAEVVRGAVKALKAGKVVAYPTDTCYGLAVDVQNETALKQLYKIKERSNSQPIHIVVPSLEFAKKLVKWEKDADLLAKKFWPGALTLVLPLISKASVYTTLSAKSGFLGVRMPDHSIAADIARGLGRPITTTSANPSKHISGGYDSYTAADVYTQFEHKKYKPDFIVDAGKLPKRKPSTIIRIREVVEIIRPGHITHAKIKIHVPHVQLLEQNK